MNRSTMIWRALTAKPNVGNRIAHNSGQAKVDNTPPAQRESTQNPVIDSGRSSPGDAVPFAQLPIVNAAAFNDNAYDMSPLNASHWSGYLVKRLEPVALNPIPNVPNLIAAIAEPQQLVTGGSTDYWKSHYQLMRGSMGNSHSGISSYHG